GAYAVLMEKAEQQCLRRQTGIDQLARGAGAHQDDGAPPAILGGVAPRCVALGRQPLDHQAAAAPARDAAIVRTACHRHFEPGLDLLGLAEIMMGAFGQRRTLQLDDALIAIGMLALVDGEGEMAGAQQARHRIAETACAGRRRLDRFREPLGIILRIAAYRAGAGHVGDQQADRPIAARLQGEDAVIFERARQSRGERDRLAQHQRHRFRIVVTLQYLIQYRAEPHETAAQPGPVDLKRLDKIVGNDIRHHAIPRPRATCRLGSSRGGWKRGRAQARHQARMPFCACSRFSASSHTTDWGPSMTPAVTSSPRLAGRQCMKMAPALALAISRSSTRYGASMLWRLTLASTPIDTQVSVTTQSAPWTASSGLAVTRTRPPSALAQSSTRCGGSGDGGQAMRRSKSKRTAACTQLTTTLLPSPLHATTLPAAGPLCSSSVMTSAMIWQGWLASVRPLMTGTVACCASSSSFAACVVRIMMAST